MQILFTSKLHILLVEEVPNVMVLAPVPTDTTFYFYGYYAGFNATIHCHGDVSCIINCIGNACYNMNLNCGPNNCLITCDRYGSSEYCPSNGNFSYNMDNTISDDYYSNDVEQLMIEYGNSNVVSNEYENECEDTYENNDNLYCDDALWSENACVNTTNQTTIIASGISSVFVVYI